MFQKFKEPHGGKLATPDKPFPLKIRRYGGGSAHLDGVKLALRRNLDRLALLPNLVRDFLTHSSLIQFATRQDELS